MTDVDECAESPGCDHTCSNDQGSYHCVCDTGYSLASDKHTCIGLYGKSCSGDRPGTITNNEKQRC